MPEQSYKRLVALKDKIEASSHAEVIRRALQLYEALIEEAEKIVAKKKTAGKALASLMI